MTFKFTRILSLALFLLCLALVCTACKPKDPSQGNEEDNPMLTLIENGATAYTVVRPDNCEVVLRTCVTTFVRALKSVSGAETVNVMTDAEDVTALEILVGNTNRPETSEVKARLGQDDYRIEIVNDKPVIVGRDDSAAAFALRLFMQEVVGFRSSSDYDPKEAVTLPLDLCLTGKISNTAADPRNPDDVLIYTVNVLDFGAYGDGTTDDTKAFQSAIDHVYKLGGGTVYAPAGEYLIKGSLTVKRSVYLAGAWSNPDENPGDIKKGTILLATGNKGKADGSAMITIGASAGVMGLTVYYPEQGLVKPGEYPAAILIKDNLAGDGTQHASSVQCVTIVNAWRGIAADKGNQLPRIDNVYISALDYGFKINKCYDCARITSMHIGPDYWAAFTGEDRATVAKQMQQSATGIILMRTDGQMMYDISVDSCQTGLSLERNPDDNGATAGYSNIAKLDIKDCYIGIRHKYNSASISMATISTAGEGSVGILAEGTDTESTLRLYDCKIKSKGACAWLGDTAKGTLAIQNSLLDGEGGKNAVLSYGGVLILTNNEFIGCEYAYAVSENTLTAAITNNKFTGQYINQLDEKHSIVQTDSVATLPDTPDFTLDIPLPPAIGNAENIYNVLDYGAVGDGVEDDTLAFDKALNAAKKTGGIVYVPAGYYNVTERLIIPTGVELRGVHESMHVTTGEGSVIYITDAQGEADGDAFITMQEGSSLRGLTFWYPEQAWNSIKAYPYAVRVMGKNCVLRDLCFGNTYQAIDMASADCGGHYVNNITGCILSQGIALDGSSEAGIIMNTHFNITFYASVWGTKLSDASGAFGSGDMAVALFNHMNANLTAYSFGETVEEQLLFIFNYRARYGMDFTGGFDGLVVGSGVDGSLCGIRIKGSYENELMLLNFMDDIVPGSTPEGNLAIYVDVDDDSTVRFVAGSASSYNYVPSGLVVLKGGNLILDGFDARVTPSSGSGAISIQGGYAEVSGIVFQHVGPLDANGQFTQQANTAQTVDVRVWAGAELDLYSAVGRDFFREKIDGDTGEYNYVTTQ